MSWCSWMTDREIIPGDHEPDREMDDRVKLVKLSKLQFHAAILATAFYAVTKAGRSAEGGRFELILDVTAGTGQQGGVGRQGRMKRDPDIKFLQTLYYAIVRKFVMKDMRWAVFTTAGPSGHRSATDAG